MASLFQFCKLECASRVVLTHKHSNKSKILEEIGIDVNGIDISLVSFVYKEKGMTWIKSEKQKYMKKAIQIRI